MQVNLANYLKFKPAAKVIVDAPSRQSTVRKTYCHSCHDLRAIGLEIPACCESCHDDADAGHDLCEVNHVSGDYLHVCCAISQWVEDNLDNDEWFRLRRAREYAERG